MVKGNIYLYKIIRQLFTSFFNLKNYKNFEENFSHEQINRISLNEKLK